MTNGTLSPREAATRAGCGRSSIMRALACGDLRAMKDNNGAWRIPEAALDDWLSLRRSPDRSSPDRPTGPISDTHSDTWPDHQDTMARLAATEARAEALAAEAAQLRGERDAARLEAAERRAEGAQLRERINEARIDRDQARADQARLLALVERLSEPRPGLLGLLARRLGLVAA